jgi:hypothetical protein
MNYWETCIEEAFEESGIVATKDQMENVAAWVDGAHDNYSMAHGHDVIRSNFISDEQRELEKLKNEIAKKERWENSTVPCRRCATTGLVLDVWGRDVECLNCGGKGRVRSD